MSYDEVNDIGSVFFNGCAPVDAKGIGITVSEAWGDWEPKRRHILLTCHAAFSGVEYSMDVDKAEALGLLLLSAARGMREMAASVDRDLAEEERNELGG